MNIESNTTITDVANWLFAQFRTGIRPLNIFQSNNIVVFDETGNFNIICTKFVDGDQLTGIAVNHWTRNAFSFGINYDKSWFWKRMVTSSDLGLNIKFGDGYVQVGADNNTSCRFYFDASVRMVSHQNGENYENNFRATSLYNIPIFETFIPTFNNTDTVAITLQHKVIDGGHIFVTNGDFVACPVPIVGIRLPDGDRTNKIEVRFASNIIGVARINILYKPYYS